MAVAEPLLNKDDGKDAILCLGDDMPSTIRDLSSNDVDPKTSMLTMTVNWITAGLGVGMLSLPWSAAGASVIPGAMVNAVVMFTMAYTMVIVAEACEKYQTFDLGALVRHLPGRTGPVMSGLSNLIIWVCNFMCLIGYMIVVADSVLPMLSDSPLKSRTLLIAAMSSICLPLCYVDQNYLAFSSWLAIAINVYLFVYVGYLSAITPWEGTPMCAFGLGKGMASMCNTVVMALSLQMLVPPMYETLEYRSVARFRTVIFTAFGFLFLLFVGFQTAALYAFGPYVPQDLLASLPHDVAGNTVRFGMIGMVLGVYPLMVMPMVAPIRNVEWGGKSMAKWVTLGIVASSMAASFYVTQLGVLNVLNGAIIVLIICTLAPALLGLQLQKNWLAMMMLVVVGSALLVCGILLPENYVDEVQNSCLMKLKE